MSADTVKAKSALADLGAAEPWLQSGNVARGSRMRRGDFIAGFASVAVWPVHSRASSSTAGSRQVGQANAPAFADVGDWCIVQG
jgi:hypothetical protein